MKIRSVKQKGKKKEKEQQKTCRKAGDGRSRPSGNDRKAQRSTARVRVVTVGNYSRRVRVDRFHQFLEMYLLGPVYVPRNLPRYLGR